MKNKIFWTIVIVLAVIAADVSLRYADKVKKSFFNKVFLNSHLTDCEKEIIKLRNERKKSIVYFNDYVWVSPEIYNFKDERYYCPMADSAVVVIRNERIDHISMLVDKNTRGLLDRFEGERYYKKYDSLALRVTGNDFTGKEIDLSILMLGDSFTEGCYVNDEDTFSAWIEKWGTDDHSVIKVFNAGVSGYSTREEYYRFVDLVSGINPNIVILNYFPNDFNIVEHKVVGYWVSREPRSALAMWLYSHSMISKLIMKEFYRHFSKPDLPTNNGEIRRGWEESLGYIKKINDICVKRGMVFAVSALPPKEQFSFGVKTYYQEKLEEFCRQYNIIFLDPYDHFKNLDLKLIYLDWDPHFTKLGQKEYGKFLYKRIRELDSVKYYGRF